ncbi:unnamed protein product [Brachionus calyciflorus]|uniref:Leucine-rich repeat and WD repeat-containing protein 1 WD domain-containing protein n=1 Tax=Brachionus calyciflorus TaxID=104777 RepID=A0A813M2K4_9BILA|nr:unnamed protein product [Brachionus calyciflorus]
MDRQNSYESVSDFAISKFKESLLNDEENHFNLMEDYNFPHWIEITDKVQSVWLKSYSDKLKIYNDDSQIDTLFNQFRTYMSKIMSKRSEYQALKKYIDYVIEFRINQIRTASFDDENDQKENVNNDENINKLALKAVVKLDALNLKPIKDLNSDLSLKKQEYIKNMNLFVVENLIRAHSKDGNINDNTTLVTDVAFEIDQEHVFGFLDNIPKYTNLFATCGNNIVNIIDSETGKIIKRFNDDLLMNRNKESFNCLAWSILNKNVSVLACAGAHGQIKIIVPKYSSCFSRIDAHTAPITCLLFHYKYSDILLSASDDNTIKIWRISLKEGSSDLDSECSNELLNTIQIGDNQTKTKETIFSMCFVSNDYFLIATRNNIYNIKLSDEILFGQKFDSPMEIQNESMTNEDVINFMTSKPKTKEYLTATPTKMIGISAQNMIYEELIIANKIIYYKDILFANLLNSNFVYIINISSELNEFNEENLVLKVVSNIKVDEGKSTEINKINLYKEEDSIIILKSSSDGNFYLIFLNETLDNYIRSMRYITPTDYVIKPYSDPGKKTNIKNYGLMEKPSVISTVYNSKVLISVTNQNMIVTLRKP